MAVHFQDNSIEVKAALNRTTVAWLHEWANEIASQAARNCNPGESYSSQLRASYRANIDEGAGIAHVGTHMEQGFWEEYGTGEYAVHGDGRKGWWVYKDGYKGKGGKRLTERQAKAMAASDPTVHATNGRQPNYTLEAAFVESKPKAIADLERKLKGMG